MKVDLCDKYTFVRKVPLFICPPLKKRSRQSFFLFIFFPSMNINDERANYREHTGATPVNYKVWLITKQVVQLDGRDKITASSN